MKTQPAFVRAKGAIHLNAKTPVHLDLAFIVNPRDPKLNHPLRFDQTLQNLAIPILLVAPDDRPNRFQHFGHRLKKLRLVGITFLDDSENFLNESHNNWDYCLKR